ncbi:Centromere protein S, partial [Lemmus lemmus]
FRRHAKRSTVTTEDVKLLARRSNSLLKYITEKNEEIAQLNLERKAKKKMKPEDESSDSREPSAQVVGSDSREPDARVVDSES